MTQINSKRLKVKTKKTPINSIDARLMMSEMRRNKLLTPKGASLAINKNVREWTDRRALRDIRYISSVKKTRKHVNFGKPKFVYPCSYKKYSMLNS